MASFFGEVLESSSRAYDGNCEDISRPNDPIDTIRSYELSWRVDDDPAEKALFIMLDGKCAIGLSDSLRCHGSIVAEISESKRKKDDDASWKTSASPSFIYKLSNGVYVCEVSPSVKLVNANYFSESVPFVRGLCNSTFSSNGGKMLTPLIGNCNIVTGVPASVFLWCSLMKISASVYVCYTPKEEVDSILWQMIVNLLSTSWPVKDFLSKVNFKEKETVNRTGNLYL
ncbi:hypothetical protein J437_LFUL016183 [Ladona fulva]|uniref:Proteasome assembly chaperone 1 n=1 Tax=Ladona fulva TaxID=123851 RepID=A0A8K0KNU5_LADFU|nr:hypothetical protein J437_LFUL016183 [Ladona fulva]